jgi:poly(3-hydroxybutyrate) depolymerase
VPPKLPAGKVPLVIALHGTGGTPVGMESSTQFDQLARTHGFIVAYLASGSPGDNWILPSETASISAMIDHLEASEPFDPTRVYVTGFSTGGYESYRSGCLLSNKVAAIAPVGVSMNQALYQTCRAPGPSRRRLSSAVGMPATTVATAGCHPRRRRSQSGGLSTAVHRRRRADRRHRGRRTGESGQGARMGALWD